MQLKLTSGNRPKILVWEQLVTDQTDPWQVIPRQVFTPYYCLLISVAFVVLCRVGCLWVTDVYKIYRTHSQYLYGLVIGTPDIFCIDRVFIKSSNKSTNDNNYRLLVGAPKSFDPLQPNVKSPGVLFRCPIDNDIITNCEEVIVDTTGETFVLA